MANKRSSKQDIEKALNAKAKELGRKPTEGTINSWLTEIGVHPNTHNYNIARAWQEGFQEKKSFVRDEVPESDLAELREAQRDGNYTIEQILRRSYSAAVGKIRSEAQMRVDAADRRAAESAAEKDFLLESWRATESEVDESRELLAACEKELEEARLEIAGLQGRVVACNELIARLAGSAPRGDAVVDVSGSINEGQVPISVQVAPERVDNDNNAPAGEAFGAPAAGAPVQPDMTELARQLRYGPSQEGGGGDDGGDGDNAVEAGRTGAASSAPTPNADTGKDQPPAIATPPASGGQVEMPLATDADADQADGGDDDRG